MMSEWAQRLVGRGVLAAVVIAASGAFAAGSVQESDARAAGKAQAIKETTNPTAAGVRPGMAGSFLSGRFAKKNQDLMQAARYVSETLAHDPNNEALRQEAMRMHLLAGNVPMAIELAHSLSKTQAGDPLVASLLMLEKAKTGDYAAATQAIHQASSNGLFGMIRPVMVEWLSLAQKTNKGPFDLHRDIEKAGFFAPFLEYQAALMNDVAGYSREAAQSYARAIAEPAVTPYRVVEAATNFYARQGQWKEYKATYEAYAKANPQSSLLPDSLEQKAVPAPLVVDAKQGLAELFFTTASIFFGEDATQETFLYLRIALDLRPNLPPAKLMLANLYEQVEDYAQAIATYDTIPESSVFHRRAQVRKALNYEALGQREKALELLTQLSERFPKDASALITKGDMERDAKDYASAAETYGQAIARTEPLSAEDWPLLYARGISYERSGKWDKAEADFIRALTLEPNQPDVLNYLAYSWLTMNKNLDKARDYLEVASSQRPEDAHIIDSVGWAYYLAGDFVQAVAKFEQAIEMMPDDATVNEHLGDAYWRVGRETEARYQWERALTFKPEDAVADALREKLASGLPPLTQSASQLTANHGTQAN